LNLRHVSASLRGMFQNDGGGVLINKASGVVAVDGIFNNESSGTGRGTIDNHGEINIGATGKLANEGFVNNYAVMNNAGVFEHTSGDVRAHCGSLFTGNAIITGNAIAGPAPRNWCDSNAPALDLPAPTTAEATGPAGAAVSYHVIAKDDIDPSPSVVCTPASGASFALGTTSVACTASDYVGNSSSGNFNVTVVDTTAPVITLLGQPSVVVVQHNPYVDAGATASDLVDGDLTSSIAITDAVDATVPGSYTVEYRVSDGAGNEATGSRTVEVLTPVEAVDGLITQVGALDIEQSTRDELLRPLVRASQLLHDESSSNDRSACRLLGVFDGTVRRHEGSGELTADLASALTSRAAEIKVGLGCR
ncbi:MAG TPA: DUF5011 domain-containing protein, partial [Actinomycetota bacterium]|nr:DUF5011 domain-containing protein [Actinomycetota bacterium]